MCACAVAVRRKSRKRCKQTVAGTGQAIMINRLMVNREAPNYFRPDLHLNIRLSGAKPRSVALLTGYE